MFIFPCGDGTVIHKHVCCFQARKRKLGLLEDEDIAKLASAASTQGIEFAEKDATKEDTPSEIAKSHGKLSSIIGDIMPMHAVTLLIKYA